VWLAALADGGNPIERARLYITRSEIPLFTTLLTSTLCAGQRLLAIMGT
jgi:hypothetical protein